MTQTMRADGLQLSRAEPDISSLLGDWTNSSPHTDYITGIKVFTKDDLLIIQPRASFDWGPAEAVPYVVSGKTEVAGFHARYDFGTVHTELAANEKFGVLVIQSYTSFTDGRLSHYSREFFHRAYTGPLPGQWVNSNKDTSWITGFTLSPAGELQVHAATEPGDWGTVQATTYVDNLGEPAFRAEYALPGCTATLAANTNKGLIIIAAFLAFEDDRPNYLCREFFFRRTG